MLRNEVQQSQQDTRRGKRDPLGLRNLERKEGRKEIRDAVDARRRLTQSRVRCFITESSKASRALAEEGEVF